MKKTIGMMMILSSLTSTAMASEAAKPVDLSTVKILCHDYYVSEKVHYSSVGFGSGHKNEGKLTDYTGENYKQVIFTARDIADNEKNSYLYVQAEVINGKSFRGQDNNRVEVTARLSMDKPKEQTVTVFTELKGEDQLEGTVSFEFDTTLMNSSDNWKKVGVSCDITAKAKK